MKGTFVLKSDYDQLRKYFKELYFLNRGRVLSGKDVYDLHFAVLSQMIIQEGNNELSKYILRQAISLGLSYEQYVIAARCAFKER